MNQQPNQNEVSQPAIITNSKGQKFEAPFPGPVTSEAIQNMLDANQQLIKLCVDLQNDPSPSARQELQKVHARLHKNLSFLAAIADTTKGTQANNMSNQMSPTQ